MIAIFIAVTQENEEQEITEQADTFDPYEEYFSLGYEETGEQEELEFFPAGPPRWFRSNAGGMTLEEIPSRLGALRYEHALVIDYVTLDELDSRLLPFYKDGYAIEIRVLYHNKEETRRQWLFLDRTGNIMLNAAFPSLTEEPAEQDSKEPAGFIEVYNNEGRIARDYSLFNDGAQTLTGYFYNEGVLVRAETREKAADAAEYTKTYTDNYMYNRSYSLRRVERVFHEDSGIEPVSLVFPGRVLDAAREKDFIKDKLIISSDFLDIQKAETGSRMVFDTDSKGRTMGETLYNNKNEVVWTVKNTWVGDRVTAILKIEGDEQKLTEYDYDASGNRIAQRDIHNGVLERQVFIDGNKETEELYINGVVALRAFWEDGRKISEERIRRR